MRNKLYPSEYLALLTVKYDVDSDKFFNALVSASKEGKAECGNLHVECRSKHGHVVTLLITQDSRVIAQFKIPEEFFSKTKNPIKGVKPSHMNEKYSSKKVTVAQSFQIKDLRVGMKKVKLKAKVEEVSKPRYVVTRFGNCASVANAMVSDDTGKIKLCLWNEQISSIAVGDTVQIENASISAFKNERQLRVGKNGVLRIAQNVALDEEGI
jgi:Single-stranded DNA binding protein Ssb-like, OB fold